MRGDAPAARWDVDVRAVVDATGVDLRGPAVHGKRGERFLYLTWGDVGADGSFAMFRRAKLMVADIDPALLADAARDDGALRCELGLTDDRGGPRCAACAPTGDHVARRVTGAGEPGESSSERSMRLAGTVIELRDVDGGAGATCRAILDQLPTWFGIPEANDDYAASAETRPGVVASLAGVDVGITTIRRHFATTAEVYLMAVAPAHHRQGIGQAMLRHVEAGLRREGVEFLQVKTLAASRPDEGYARTRRFWLACGFVPLEEFPTLWDPANPALQLIKTVQA